MLDESYLRSLLTGGASPSQASPLVSAIPAVNWVNSTFGIPYRVLKLVGSMMSSRQ